MEILYLMFQYRLYEAPSRQMFSVWLLVRCRLIMSTHFGWSLLVFYQLETAARKANKLFPLIDTTAPCCATLPVRKGSGRKLPLLLSLCLFERIKTECPIGLDVGSSPCCTIYSSVVDR